MEKRSVTKRFTVVAIALASAAFLASSVVGLWQLAQTPAPIRVPTQNAQAEAQANSALEDLRKNATDNHAIQRLEAVFVYYVQQRDRPQAIATLEKLSQAAPKAPNAQQYQEVLTKLKASPSPSASSSPKTNPKASPKPSVTASPAQR
jgi:hypothetical protein